MHHNITVTITFAFTEKEARDIYNHYNDQISNNRVNNIGTPMKDAVWQFYQALSTELHETSRL